MASPDNWLVNIVAFFLLHVRKQREDHKSAQCITSNFSFGATSGWHLNATISPRPPSKESSVSDWEAGGHTHGLKQESN